MRDDAPRGSPYQGLTPFDEHDAAYFFGRERDARLIAADLYAAPITLLYGASGVGKSSVLRAGVLPLLRSREDVLAILFNTWQADPLTQLKLSVTKAVRHAAAKDVEQSRSFRHMISEAEPKPLAEFLGECAKIVKRRLMIILDQFEEHSLYHADEDDFTSQFPEATTRGDLSASFIVSLREEALARLDRFEGRIPTLFDSYRRIEHLSEAAARAAIVKPLEKFAEDNPDRSVPSIATDALIDTVLEQVSTGRLHVGETGRGIFNTTSRGRIEAPYLQLVMTRLWNEERDVNSHVIRLETLRRLGDAERIVQTHLDTVMARFSQEEQDTAARVFQFLVTPSGAKVAHASRDLADYAGVDIRSLSSILESLTNGSDRILRQVPASSQSPDELRYEIFHDRLAPAILDWRARHMRNREIGNIKRQEATVGQALQHSFQAALATFDLETRRYLADALPLFISTPGTRREQTLGALAEAAGFHDMERFFKVMTTLEDHGILVRVSSRRGGHLGEPRFTLAHDLLVPVVLNWVDEQRDRDLGRQSSISGRTEAVEEQAGDAASTADAAKPEPPYDSIGGLWARGRLLLVLGPGVAASARLRTETGEIDTPPLPRELARLLSDDVSLPREVVSNAGLSEIASYYAFHFGRSYIDERLRGVFTRRYTMSDTHRYVAEVARRSPPLILTTTLDSVMEDALDELDVPYDLAYNMLREGGEIEVAWKPHGSAHPKICKPREIQPTSDSCFVYKLFGSADRSDPYFDSYIVTEEDQLSLMSVVGSGGLTLGAVEQAFVHSHVLYMGTGMGGWAERLLISVYRHKQNYASTRSWAILFKPSMLELARWKRSHVDTYEQDLNEFIAQIRRRIDL